jgi:hypothetical protein
MNPHGATAHSRTRVRSRGSPPSCRGYGAKCDVTNTSWLLHRPPSADSGPTIKQGQPLDTAEGPRDAEQMLRRSPDQEQEQICNLITDGHFRNEWIPAPDTYSDAAPILFILCAGSFEDIPRVL